MVVYWTSYIGCLTGFCEPLLPPCRFPNSLKNVLHDRCDRISLIGTVNERLIGLCFTGIWFYWMMQWLFGLLHFLQKKPVVRSAPSGQGRTTRGRKTLPSLQVNKVRRTNFRRVFYPERSNPAAEPSGTASGPSSSVEPQKARKRRPVRGTKKIAASLSEITLRCVCVYAWLAVWAWAWHCFRFHFVWLITICELPHLLLIISW